MPDAGTCNIRAPQSPQFVMKRGRYIHYASWPITFTGDWCGEHQPKPEEVAR